MISCGEASGDLYAGALVEELRRAEPGVEVFGFGGRDACGRRRRAHRRLRRLQRHRAGRGAARAAALLRPVSPPGARGARSAGPSVFVAIDFPDFNFRLGQAVKALGIPVVYYISPQLWAWRPARLQTMKRFVDRVLPIFPVRGSASTATPGIPVRVRRPSADRSRARVRAIARRSCAGSGSTRQRRPWRCCRAAGRTSCARSCPILLRAARPDGAASCPACSSCSRARRI